MLTFYLQPIKQWSYRGPVRIRTSRITQARAAYNHRIYYLLVKSFILVTFLHYFSDADPRGPTCNPQGRDRGAWSEAELYYGCLLYTVSPYFCPINMFVYFVCYIHKYRTFCIHKILIPPYFCSIIYMW